MTVKAMSTAWQLLAASSSVHRIPTDDAGPTELVQFLVRPDRLEALVHVGRETAVVGERCEPLPELLVRYVDFSEDVDRHPVVREDDRKEHEVEQEPEGMGSQLNGEGEGGPAISPR